jgi:hypothetical protein
VAVPAAPTLTAAATDNAVIGPTTWYLPHTERSINFDTPVTTRAPPEGKLKGDRGPSRGYQKVAQRKADRAPPLSNVRSMATGRTPAGTRR